MGEEILLSIDTTSSDVARAAVEAGVNMVNDVSGGVADSKMTQTVADLNVPYVYNLVPTRTLHTHTHKYLQIRYDASSRRHKNNDNGEIKDVR